MAELRACWKSDDDSDDDDLVAAIKRRQIKNKIAGKAKTAVIADHWTHRHRESVIYRGVEDIDLTGVIGTIAIFAPR
jgi:hypothetical protein